MAKLPPEVLEEKEMDCWVRMMEDMSIDDLGRAHEMLHAAIMEIRRHRSERAVMGDLPSLLRTVRDLEERRSLEPNWDLAAAEQLELAIRNAVQCIVHPESKWVLLSPEEASLVKDALEDAHQGPEGRYTRDCWGLFTTRFERMH